ncbi:MAG: hypothetical protein R3C53_05555 [Pirellulaceae bacterium]
MVDPLPPIAKERCCEICEEAIHGYRSPQSILPRNALICHSVHCQRIATQKHQLHPPLYQRLVEIERRRKQAECERIADENRRLKLLDQKFAAENEKARQSALQQCPRLSPNIRIVNIPSGLSRLGPLPKPRIEAYRAHLEEKIEEAAQFSHSSEINTSAEVRALRRLKRVEKLLSERDELRSISDRLCGICKGGCCAGGKEHAYISLSTIRRFMDDHPAFSPADVLDSYLNKLSTETIEGSCVNHTNTGCGLPREMRSDTCNSFYCNDINNLQLEAAENELASDGLIAVQRAHTHWDRESAAACHDVTGIHLLNGESVVEISIPGD